MTDTQVAQDPVETGGMAGVASQGAGRATRPLFGWVDAVRLRLGSLWVRRTSFWEHVRRFGSWFEFEAATVAEDRHESEITIDLAPEGTVRSLRIGNKPHDHELHDYGRLWEFLGSLGIRTVRLDARLERNQIEDIVGLLHCHREALRAGRVTRNSVLAQLTGPQGLHVACTQTSLRGHTLAIVYTYCTLRFSRVVHWFEQHNEKFHDHRTLFHTAPRYAALIALAVSGPGMVLAAVLGHSVLCAILCSSALALFGLAYMFFMVVGSVEYDNEEKAYNLSKAYGRLKGYTDRIRSEMEQARAVQETFLPDSNRMPLQDRIEWASSFAPAEEVGGDYFDVAELDENRVVILFSDVSGHGMPAAFITAVMKTTFRGWLDTEDTLEGLARLMNANLLRLVPLDSFAAVFVAIYDVSTRRLTYANCGHQPEPWHIPSDGGRVIRSLSEARNLVMGIEEQTDIITSRVATKAGDMILLVSDGIAENPNIDSQLYGTGRFEAFLQARRALEPAQLVEAIANEAQDYSSGTHQSDDRTILALRIKA